MQISDYEDSNLSSINAGWMLTKYKEWESARQYVANYYVSMDEKSEAWKVGNAARQPNTDIW